MSGDFETAIAERARPRSVEKVVRRARGTIPGQELDPERASIVRIGDRQWSFVLTSEAAQEWDKLGSRALVVAVLIYEQSGAAAPFVHREIAIRPGKKNLVVDVREGGVARWTGEGLVNADGALEFKVPIDRDNAPTAGVMAGVVTRDGEVRLTEGRLPKPVNARQPALVAEDQA
jgi:hypothetical protein